MRLDRVDLKILELLHKDARLSHAMIGKAVGMTGPSIYARIQRLERDGVIKNYSVVLDAEKIGLGLVAFIRAESQANIEGVELFEQFVLNEPQILECHDVDGQDSDILKVRTASPQTLRALISKIRSLPGITHTITSIALTTIKEGVISEKTLNEIAMGEITVNESQYR